MVWESMLIVELSGGLGNQMFEYATGRALAARRGELLTLDMVDFDKNATWSYGLDQFVLDPGIERVTSGRLWRKVRGALARRGLRVMDWGVHREASLCFDEQVMANKRIRRIVGYFQSEKYFFDQRALILREFVPKDPLSSEAMILLQRIQRAEHPVSLHVRRGDYLKPGPSGVYAALDLSYYHRAESYLRSAGIRPTFFVFSDDPDWCRTNLHLESKAEYTEPGKRLRNVEDLWLMSRCGHHVIANSSFSWWGAWLCGNPNQIVVAPAQWFTSEVHDATDIVPERWIRL